LLSSAAGTLVMIVVLSGAITPLRTHDREKWPPKLARHGLTLLLSALFGPPSASRASRPYVAVISALWAHLRPIAPSHHARSGMDVEVDAQQDEPPREDRQDGAAERAKPAEAQVAVIPGDHDADDDVERDDEPTDRPVHAFPCLPKENAW